MYKYKLKEIEVGDTEIRGGKKSTVTDIDPETGAITWDVADTADFSSTYKALKQAKDFLDTLEKTGESKDDAAIDQFAEEIANLFNSFRSHVRKNYPEQYERVLRLKETALAAKIIEPLDKALEDNDINLDKNQILLNKIKELIKGLKEQSATSQGGASFTPGEGAQYATPFAFKKKGKKSPSIYYYKLGYKPVPKKIKGSGLEVKQLFEYSDFQEKRIAAFDEVEDRLNGLSPLLSNAKNETAEFYNENPGSYTIVYSTDYIFELLDEIENKLKKTED